MADVTCDVGDFYENVMAMFQGALDEAEAELAEEIYAAADDAVAELRDARGEWSQSEDLDGRSAYLYEKGWTAYKYRLKDGHVEAVVANKNAPGLTHLIEKGHEKFVYGRDTGTRTRARPHIRTAYEHSAHKHFGRY